MLKLHLPENSFSFMLSVTAVPLLTSSDISIPVVSTYGFLLIFVVILYFSIIKSLRSSGIVLLCGSSTDVVSTLPKLKQE